MIIIEVIMHENGVHGHWMS